MARLILVSNRVPTPTAGAAQRSGGLEVVLAPTFRQNPGVWFGWSGKVVPRDQVSTQTVERGNSAYVVTDLSEEDYHEYYNGFANRVLWPVLHYRIDLAEFNRRDLTGYLRVNQHFANELSKILRPDDLIWIYDYHLIPLGGELRQRGHTNRMGFFLHVPFPAPEVVTVLPHHERLLSCCWNMTWWDFRSRAMSRISSATLFPRPAVWVARYFKPPTITLCSVIVAVRFALAVFLSASKQKSSNASPAARFGRHSLKSWSPVW